MHWPAGTRSSSFTRRCRLPHEHAIALARSARPGGAPRPARRAGMGRAGQPAPLAAGRRRCELHARSRRSGRAGGRVGLRQVDAGVAAGAPERSRLGAHRVRRHRAVRPPRGTRRAVAMAPPRADGLPGPARQPRPAPDRLRRHRRAAALRRRPAGAEGRRAAPPRARGGAARAAGRRPAAAAPARARAARLRAWASHARWRRGPSC